VVEFHLPEKDTETSDPVLIAGQPTPLTDRTIRVPGKSTTQHSIIAAWLAQIERNYTSKMATAKVPPVRENLARRLRLLETIIRGCEAHGLFVKAGDKIGTIVLLCDGEAVRCRIREKKPNRQHPQPLSDNARKSAAVFAVTEPLGAARRPKLVWSDAAGRPLEARLKEILTALINAVPLIAQAKRRNADELRRQEEVYLNQRREASRREREEAMWQTLVGSAQELRQVRDVEMLLAAIGSDDRSQEALVGDRKLSEWIEWAEDQLRNRDCRRRGAQELFKKIFEANP
jgi:hypothetical protein